jgi:hypothetical protein
MDSMEVFMVRDFDNILDYIYHYGDLTFEEEPFNDVDNLIFAVFAYFPLEDFEPKGKDFKAKTLQDICVDYLSSTSLKFISSTMPNWMKKSIFLAMAFLKRKRYCNLMVTHFDSDFSHEDNTQFAGVCLELNNKECVVAFRGTDNSWLGFKEDFFLCCYDSVPAQQKAAEFLHNCMYHKRHHTFKVMGHSKGGCLSVYAALSLSERYQRRIDKIYSDDGPGLSLQARLSEGYKRISDKIVRLIVKDDLVGLLLNYDAPTYIIDSYSKGSFLAAHDSYNWKINGKEFVKVPDITLVSKYLSKTIDDWLNYSVSSVEERILIINALFDAIEQTEFTQPGKVLDDPFGFILQFYKYLSKDKSNKKLIAASMRKFGTKFLDNYIRYQRAKIKQSVENKANKKTEEKELIEND